MIVRNFEYLLALDREGHFGKAAQSCNVSQPTLSAGIKQLEEDLDVQIVRHSRRYDGLTQEGETVLAWAKKMYNDCDGLERELSALKRGLEGQFRLGLVAGTSVVARFLSVALAEKIPLLEQSISTGDTTSLLKSLSAHKMDMALTYLEDVPEADGFDTHLLYRERVFLFQTSEVRLPRRVTWDHVTGLPLCILNSALPNSAESQLAHRKTMTIQTNAVDVLVAHVATGRYATVLPQSLVTHLAQIANLQAITISGDGSHANVGFVAVKGGLKATPSTALLELVHTPELVKAIQDVVSLHRQFQPDGD
jgi:DNA-binding transcriptional LysR family regulator